METEEKPVEAQKPMPVMDVVPPPSAKKAPDVVEAPAETDEEKAEHSAQAAETDGDAKAEASKDKKAAPTPVPQQPPKPESTIPVAPIVLAVFFFLVLSGLAFYAYTKTN